MFSRSPPFLSSSSNLLFRRHTAAVGGVLRQGFLISSIVTNNNHQYIPSSSSSSSTSFLHLPISSSTFTPMRQYSFKHFHDESDPDVTLRHAREVKRREKEVGMKFSSRYLNALVSVAIAHFQKKDFKLARKCALYAHDMIVDHRGSTHTMSYFSAVTVAKCNRALANEMSRILDNRRETSNFGSERVGGGGGSTMIDEDMMQSTLVIRDEGKRFSSLGDMVAYYHAEADQFERLARRILELPDKYFMRTEAQHREANSQESSQTSADNDRAYASADFTSAKNAKSGGSAEFGFGIESLKHMKRRMKDEAEIKRKSFDATQRRNRGRDEYAIQREFTKESRKYRSDMANKASGSSSRFSTQGKHRRTKGRAITTLFSNQR